MQAECYGVSAILFNANIFGEKIQTKISTVLHVMMEGRKEEQDRRVVHSQQIGLHSEWAPGFCRAWCQNETIAFIQHVHVQNF